MRSRLWLIPLQMNLLILPVIALGAVMAPAWADLSRDAAVLSVQRMTNGRVLAVEQAESAQRPVWRVKVVTAAGEVWVLLLDVATGQAL